MAEMQTYLPFAERWLKDNYGTEYTGRQAESLAYLLAGCAADGENEADRCKEAAKSQHATDQKEIARLLDHIEDALDLLRRDEFADTEDMLDAALGVQEERDDSIRSTKDRHCF